jgi:hypothetical protein
VSIKQLPDTSGHEVTLGESWSHRTESIMKYLLLTLGCLLMACNSTDDLREVQQTANAFAATNGFTQVVCRFSSTADMHRCFVKLPSGADASFTCDKSNCWQ